MNIEEKKSELQHYKYYQEEIERYLQELSTIRVELYGKPPISAISYSGMPKGTDIHDFTGYSVKKLDREIWLENKLKSIYKKKQSIDNAIDDLESEEEKRIIKLHYIDKISFRKMEKIVNLSKSTIFEKFNEGIAKLVLKKDISVQN